MNRGFLKGEFNGAAAIDGPSPAHRDKTNIWYRSGVRRI